jgi:hypothetical protein
MQQTKDGILLQMPDEMHGHKIAGNIWFYCAYDAARDKKFNLELNTDAEQLFSNAVVLPGTYIVKINWTSAGKDYYTESNLTVL